MRTVALFIVLMVASISHAALDQCSRELLLSYFPSTFVQKTLEQHQIPESEWEAIISELNERDGMVVSIVEQKAATMEPNPIKVPGYRDQAVALFRETLYEVFSGVMAQHGVIDQEQVMAMLDDIQYQKAKRFIECMEQSKE